MAIDLTRPSVFCPRTDPNFSLVISDPPKRGTAHLLQGQAYLEALGAISRAAGLAGGCQAQFVVSIPSFSSPSSLPHLDLVGGLEENPQERIGTTREMSRTLPTNTGCRPLPLPRAGQWSSEQGHRMRAEDGGTGGENANLVARSDITSNDSIVNLLIAVLSLIFFALILLALLFLLRRMRRQRQMRSEYLPQYYDVDVKRTQNHRGLTIQTGNMNKGRSSVIVISQDGQPMLANPHSPPHSPDNVPEIHITFPDEHDEHGRTKSGRVLLVRVGDNAAVGLEPLHEEQLPAYEKESKSQFYAVDLEKIGGLKEKEYR
ncbi:hypothetical protein GQ53DRAFT_774618 [Thozetella sp. PMI_491]|nr:hypothetical protein GQ53DRAFT_774618 [Thozetella sp. PMI_491]